MPGQSTDNEIVSLFFSAFRTFKHKLVFKNPLFQLPLAQMETLKLIGDKQRLLMKEVAGFLAITPPSATVLVNHLVRLGYVQRNFDRLDRRTVHLSLTKKGRTILHKGILERCRQFKQLIGNLSHKEQEQFSILLKKLNH